MLALAAMAAGTFVLGLMGHWTLEAHAGGHASASSAAYHTLQLLFIHSPHFEQPLPWTLHAARWLGAACYLFAWVQLLGFLLRSQIERLRIRFARGHQVVCGLGERALGLVQQLRSEGLKVVVVDRAPDAGLAHAVRAAGALLLTGDATREPVLNAAGVGRAARLFALCPGDSVNCAIALRARRFPRRKKAAGSPAGLECVVHLGDFELRGELHQRLSLAASASDIRFVDPFDADARALLRDKMPLDGRGVAPDSRMETHLVVIGGGRMGRALVSRAAQLGHFANGIPLRITVAAPDVSACRHRLMARHPGLESVCTVVFRDWDAAQPELLQAIEARGPDTMTCVAICLEDEVRAAETALVLHRRLKLGRGDVIAVRLRHSLGLSELLLQPAPGRDAARARLVSFGLCDGSAFQELCLGDRTDELAMRLHEGYRSWRSREGDSVDHNPALRPWVELTEEFRDSNRQQVEHLPVKLRAIGLALCDAGDPRPPVEALTREQIEVLARLEHDRWMAERRLSGWTFAPGPKDCAAGTSPHIVPWERLSEEVRQYDRDFMRLIPSLAGILGKKLVIGAGKA